MNIRFIITSDKRKEEKKEKEKEKENFIIIL